MNITKKTVDRDLNPLSTTRKKVSDKAICFYPIKKVKIRTIEFFHGICKYTFNPSNSRRSLPRNYQHLSVNKSDDARTSNIRPKAKKIGCQQSIKSKLILLKSHSYGQEMIVIS